MQFQEFSIVKKLENTNNGNYTTNIQANNPTYNNHLGSITTRINTSNDVPDLAKIDSQKSHHQIQNDQNLFYTNLSSNQSLNLTDQSNSYYSCPDGPIDQSMIANNKAICNCSQYASLFDDFVLFCEEYSNPTPSLAESTIENTKNRFEFDSQYESSLPSNSFVQAACFSTKSPSHHFIHNNFPQLPAKVNNQQSFPHAITQFSDNTLIATNKQCIPIAKNIIQQHERKNSIEDNPEKKVVKLIENINNYFNQEKIFDDIASNISQDASPAKIAKLNYDDILKNDNSESMSASKLLTPESQFDFKNLIDDEICQMLCSDRMFENSKYACTRDYIYIFRFLIDNLELSCEFNSLLLKNQNYFDINHVVDEIMKKLDTKIKIAKRNIETNQNFSKIRKNFLILKNFNGKNFCFFCIREKCLMFSSEQMYSRTGFKYFYQSVESSSHSKAKSEICDLLNKIQELIQESKNNNLFSFLHLYMKNHLSLFKLIQALQLCRPCLCKRAKMTLLNEVFHNFKCNHSEIKCQLIPEFISLFFILLNRDTSAYCVKSNTMFFMFIFYLEAFNHVFNIISQFDLFSQKKCKNEKINQSMNKILISLIVRINFMSPFVILFTRNTNAALMYRFYALLLFQLQCLSLQKKEHDHEKLEFLETSIYWIFNCMEHLSSVMFFEIFQKNDMRLLFSLNRSCFQEFADVFVKFHQNEPYLESTCFKSNNENKRLLNFINYSKNGFLIYEKPLVADSSFSIMNT